MEGNFNVDALFSFLQTACKSKKDMKAIGLDAVTEASKHMRLLPRLNEKGLLILMIAKIIALKFLEFPQALKLFQAEMFPVERAPRVRRAVGEEGERRKRKRRVLQGKDLDLNELSNESILHPVGVLPPAVGEIRRLGEAEETSKGSEAEPEPEPPVDSNFAEAFTEMEQRLAAERQQQDSQATSSSSSNNSHRFGVIANYSKKMEIIGEIKLQERTVRRPRAPPGTGRRTRRKDPVVDEKIDIDEAAAPLNESLDVTMENFRARHAHLEERALYREFDGRIEEFNDRIRRAIFSEANKQRMMRFAKKGRPAERPAEREAAHEPEFTLEATEYSEQASYAAQSTMFEPPDSAYREHLDSNIFHGEERVSLKELQQRVKKPKWEVFQNLLWLSQQGEVRLEQQNPESFGEITVFRERRES